MGVEGYQCELQSDSHFSPQFSQSLTQSLLDDSEQRVFQDHCASETIIWDDWKEASFGWQLVVPYPKYATHRHRPRPRKSELSLGRKGSMKTQSDFRCLTDNNDDGRFCPWKESVEPVSYCYIPNNGWYRSIKPGPTKLSREVQEWMEGMLASKSAKSMLARQLRKAADNNAQHTRSGDSVPVVSNEADTQSQATTDMIQKRDREVSLLSLGKRCGAFPRRVNQKDRTTEILQFAAKRLQSQAHQLKSSNNRLKANCNGYFSASHTESHTTCNSGVSRKSTSELTLHDHFPLNATDKRQLTEAYLPNTTRLSIQSKNHQRYEEDLFTFIPMCRQETLRPLAKLTPKQKETEETCGQEKRLSPQTDSKGKKEQSSLQVDVIAPATATVYPPEESCGIRTARSAIARTNLRIEEMRNSPLRSSHASGKARSFFAHKGSGLALLKNGVLRYTVTK
ncbi:uncharacterized protein LOC143300684 [Babylonia areolata]|uniref:uncharacterized protein LOC143300684 n=1 Tax=Babylonia areolata TaxID=304850 RepID=UPI003FD395CD